MYLIAGFKGIAVDRAFTSKLPSAIPPLPEWIYEDARKQCQTLGISPDFIRIYSRVTLVLDDPSISFNIQPQRNVHIVAVQPTTEKLFQMACLQLDADIISLNMDEKLPFYLKHSLVGAAVERGIHFELCYKNSLVGNHKKMAPC